MCVVLLAQVGELRHLHVFTKIQTKQIREGIENERPERHISEAETDHKLLFSTVCVAVP